MIEIEDREFFDKLYALWSKTTGAQDRYWVVEPDEEAPDVHCIYAVDDEQERKLIASFFAEEDADFIASIHGCLADLVRRLHDALDEADRADYDRDSRECRIAELETQVMEMEKELGR